MNILNPAMLLNKIGIEAGTVVADFGAGSGYFALELARRVGEKGMVYAVDVLKSSLESIRSLAKMNELSNIETRWANLEKTSTLESNSCDLIVISNFLFQVNKEHWSNIFKEAFKVLKSNGILLVVDWKEDSELGPSKEERVSKEEVKGIIEEYFKFNKEIEAGTSHWAMLFSK